jgi:hypothetical protein
MKTISLKVSSRQLRLLDEATRVRGVTRSDVIRECIDTLDAKPRKQVTCLDLMRDLIGKHKGPPDLGTNPKYMEGYGE